MEEKKGEQKKKKKKKDSSFRRWVRCHPILAENSDGRTIVPKPDMKSSWMRTFTIKQKSEGRKKNNCQINTKT